MNILSLLTKYINILEDNNTLKFQKDGNETKVLKGSIPNFTYRDKNILYLLTFANKIT